MQEIIDPARVSYAANWDYVGIIFSLVLTGICLYQWFEFFKDYKKCATKRDLRRWVFRLCTLTIMVFIFNVSYLIR